MDIKVTTDVIQSAAKNWRELTLCYLLLLPLVTASDKKRPDPEDRAKLRKKIFLLLYLLATYLNFFGIFTRFNFGQCDGQYPILETSIDFVCVDIIREVYRTLE